MSFLREFLAFLRTRKKYWLLPTIVMVVLLGVLFVVVQGSVIAPFIYALF